MSPQKSNPTPPKHLSAASKRWWASVVDSYELKDHHLRLLTLAAESWDQCVEARKAIAEHGMTFVDRHGAPRPRPEIGIERDCKISFARLVRELGLDNEDEPEAPRPPRVGGGK